MAATLIKCERCLSESGDSLIDPGYFDIDRPIKFYKEADGRIHCEACIDGEVVIEPKKEKK